MTQVEALRALYSKSAENIDAEKRDERLETPTIAVDKPA